MLTLGFAMSHPLLCNFFGAQLLTNESTPQPHMFEFMLTRSPHNSDLKGLRSMRNIEIGLSELLIVNTFGKLGNSHSHTNFKMNYNLAKENFERELIFQDSISSDTIDSFYFGDLKPFDEDISDSREVEFMRA